MMTVAGLRSGSHSACAFYHEKRNIRLVTHGDDFTAFGASQILDWFRGVAQQRVEVKFKGRLERGKPGAVGGLEQDCLGDGEGFGARGRLEACGYLEEGRGL